MRSENWSFTDTTRFTAPLGVAVEAAGVIPGALEVIKPDMVAGRGPNFGILPMVGIGTQAGHPQLGGKEKRTGVAAGALIKQTPRPRNCRQKRNL